MCAIKYWGKLKLVHIGLCKVRFGSFSIVSYNSRTKGGREEKIAYS